MTNHSGRLRLQSLAGLALISVVGIASSVRADEGMWLLNNPPAKQMQERHGFAPSKEWLEHAQKSAVRFNTGGSGSLVSASGLVMTNHHVGSDMLSKLSTPEKNLLKEGFNAKSQGEELKCPDLELNILWEIEDVTDKVSAAIASAGANLSTAEIGKARRQGIATIEKASKDSTGLKSEVVTLYGGSKYHLYRYKAYTDVRLVFAPEESIAFFGGDTDNFEFPRFNLDCCFFRIYENDKPIKPEHYFKWSQSGAAENELVFVVGHPGRTERLNTYEHLKVARDIEMPRRLAELYGTEIRAQGFAGRSAENARIIRDELFGVANGRKVFTGQLQGLEDPALLAAKKSEEDKLRAGVNADPDKKAKWGDAWDTIAKIKHEEQTLVLRREPIGRVLGAGQLMGSASTIVRLVAELPKPSSERLREFGDARLDSLYLGLYSPEPVYDAREIFNLTNALSRASQRLGGDDPTVVAMLAGKSPSARAAELVKGSTLRTPEARKALAASGIAGVAASTDPMIQLALLLDKESRELRKKFEDTVESPLRDAYAKVGAARFSVLGDSVYPDATFTLRLSYGPIKGYTEAGQSVPAFTNFAGLYERYESRKGQEGFELPPSWLGAKGKLDMKVPFNFVCTADIIGGNSGSPIVNKQGEIVGLIFDGNIQSLVGNYVYDDQLGRAVAVDSRGMIEAFRSVYGAERLLSELMGR